MKKNADYFFVAIMIMTLSVLVTGSGCSRNKSKAEDPKVKEVQEAISNLDQEESSGSVLQEGDECKVHRYYFSPEQSASMTFEVMVSANTAKKANTEEPTVFKRELESRGYPVTYVSRSVDTFTKPAPIWIVSHAMFGKREGKPTTKEMTFGFVRIVGNESGEGVIESVWNVKGSSAVGQLSREELAKRMNGKSTVALPDMDSKYYEVTPERRFVDQEFHILSVEFLVDGLGSSGSTLNARGGASWDGWGIYFDITYDSARKKYVITGPAYAKSCIKEPSEYSE